MVSYPITKRGMNYVVMPEDWNALIDAITSEATGHVHDGLSQESGGTGKKISTSNLLGHDKAVHDALNINADLLDGKHASEFIDPTEDETISGQWTFTDKLLCQGLPFPTIISGQNSAGAIYLGGGLGSPTSATGGIEASWGGATNPQIGIGVVRDGPKANILMNYLGRTYIRNGTTNLMYIDETGNVTLPAGKKISDSDKVDGLHASELGGGATFSICGTIIVPTAINLIAWYAPFACTVTKVLGYRVGGTGASINARKNGSLNHLSSAKSLTSANSWMDGGGVQNTSYSAGDKMEIMIVSVAGDPTQVAVEVVLTRS